MLSDCFDMKANRKSSEPSQVMYPCRFPPFELELVRAAAKIRGMSVNKFVTRAAAAAASRVLKAGPDRLLGPVADQI
jgi:uncharacterized protein (DUF1778 family)